MVISNVVFYYYRAKLCVRQILPVTHPRFSPPMQYDTYDRYDYDLPEKGSVGSNIPPQSPPLNSYISILANVHWVSLLKVIELCIHCLCYKRSNHPLAKPTLCPRTHYVYRDTSHKTFSRNIGEHYANYH